MLIRKALLFCSNVGYFNPCPKSAGNFLTLYVFLARNCSPQRLMAAFFQDGASQDIGLKR